METQDVFNNFDYIVLSIIVVSGLLALLRGFVRELFSLVAWVGAYFIGTKFYGPAVPLVQDYIKSDRVAEWAAIAIVFTVVLILLSIAGYFVSGFIKGKALTIIDRSLGFLYGLLRGALIVSLVYLGAVMILWPDMDEAVSKTRTEENEKRNEPPDFLLKARTRPLLSYGARTLMLLVPKEMIDKELKNVEAQKLELQEAVRQRALDAAEAAEEEIKGPIDIDKLFNTEKQP